MNNKVDILLVDDRPENLLVLENLLDDPHYNIVKTTSPFEALQLVSQKDFALALVDVVMPEMGGFEMAEIVRSVKKTKTLPIIFITATKEMKEKTFNGYQSGAVDFLYKPIEPEILKHKIDVFGKMYQHRIDVQRRQDEAIESRRLAEAKVQELTRSNQTKTDFLSHMSHELRNPLNSIILLSQILERNEDQNLTSKQMQFVRTIHESGQELLELIEQTLDLSKIEAGVVNFELQEVNIYQIPAYVKEQFEERCKAKGLDLKIEVSNDLPPSLISDWTKLRQVLKNLMDNAIKYTAKGHIQLKIERTQADQEFNNPALDPTKTIAIRFTDTGMGIDSDRHELIFEAFKQEHSGGTSTEGAGLGLSISKQLAYALEGELNLTSAPGKGSTFTIYLPEHLGAPEAPQVPSAGKRSIDTYSAHRFDADENPFLGRKVLLVDDDVRTVFTLTELLERVGCRVIPAYNAGDCMRALSEDPTIEMVLVDMVMPEEDGYQCCKRIREQACFEKLPVIAMTGKAMEGDRERCLIAGASEYTSKPIDSAILFSLMQGLFEQA